MEIINDSLPILSQSIAGLLLASLVVLVVLLIGIILYRKSHKPGSEGEETQDAPPLSQDAAPLISQGAKAARPQTAKPDKKAKVETPPEPEAENVVTLKPDDDDPTGRAERFDKLASDALSEGRLGDAKNLFEKALFVAMDHDVKPIAAHARYELGNLAKASSDLMGACENWQMARTLYEESGDKKKVRELDSVMADSGCPSDWVLNNF